MAVALLGPPELHEARSDPSSEPGNPTPAIQDPFTTLVTSKFNKTNLKISTRPPPIGETENKSATYTSSGSPSLDFFFHVVTPKDDDSLHERLNEAWDHDPFTALKLMCNLRGVRGFGKNDREAFYMAAFWLHEQHPKTLACNIPYWVEFGCYKDLPELLYRLVEYREIRDDRRAAWNMCKEMTKTRKRSDGSGPRRPFEAKKKIKRKSGGQKSQLVRELAIANALKRSKLEKEAAREERKKKNVRMAKKALDKYTHDPDFRFLHDRISDFFAGKLRSDVKYLNSFEIRKISIAAKWCPSLDSAYDKVTLLCETIAKKVFPREEYPEYEGIEEAHYAYRVRDRLRKEVLVPLRKALELPEVYIGAKRWDLVKYNRVASVAMRFYKEKFLRHDGDRFVSYLKAVKDGKAKISAGALLPHEIIQGLYDGEKDGGEVAELQWKRMVADLLKKGKKLKNCLAMCAVSGALNGTPMEASLALGVLVSELSDDPWKGRIITFSENPRLEVLRGESLLEKIQFIRAMELRKIADFQKVFDLILKVAVDGKLSEKDMVKRVFVFSDMEFDKASYNPWETDYHVIVRKFKEEGYNVPEMVFWNVRDSKATPVPGFQKGVALVGGFSRNLMKLFLDGDGVLSTPMDVMDAAFSGEEFDKLVVMD